MESGTLAAMSRPDELYNNEQIKLVIGSSYRERIGYWTAGLETIFDTLSADDSVS